MFASLVRRPLAQSPRCLRVLAARPVAVPSVTTSALRPFSSTIESEPVTDTAAAQPTEPVSSDAEEKIINAAEQSAGEGSSQSASRHTVPRFSEGSDADKLSAELKTLTEQKSWRLNISGRAIYKTFHFKSFGRCLDFAQSVGIQSKYSNHHPILNITPNTVKVIWTTHVPAGLSEKDFAMAHYCDRQADFVGVILPTKGAAKGNGDLVRRVRMNSDSS